MSALTYINTQGHILYREPTQAEYIAECLHAEAIAEARRQRRSCKKTVTLRKFSWKEES